MPETRISAVEAKWLSTREAAARLGRKPSTLRGWARFHDGPVTPVRLHKRWLWPAGEVDKVVAEAEAERTRRMAC